MYEIYLGSFGKDQKKFIPPHIIRNSIEHPPIGTYDIPTDVEVNKFKNRGSSFGYRISRDINNHQYTNMGKYDVIQKPGEGRTSRDLGYILYLDCINQTDNLVKL